MYVTVLVICLGARDERRQSIGVALVQRLAAIRGRGARAGERRSGGALGGLGSRLALALVLGEQLLAQAHARRRHFDELVVVDELERLLEREPDRRRQDDVLVGSRGTDVRELLAADDAATATAEALAADSGRGVA